MAKGNVKFTTRVRAAVGKLWDDAGLNLITLRSGSMFSPVFRNGNYEWLKIMDSDGMLVKARTVKDGEGANPDAEVELLVGVVLQCEDATSRTKPNPLGKASISHVANGIWVDTRDGGRRRVDRVHVLMLLPKGEAPQHQKDFLTASRNVRNAADMMPDCDVLEVARGMSTKQLAQEIKKKVRRWLQGRGRPKVN